MLKLFSRQIKTSDQVNKVGKSIRWHHVALGFMVYGLIVGGLVWHATQPKQPAIHAGSSPTSSYVYINIEVNGSNAASYDGDQVVLYSGNYGFGSCSSGPNVAFYEPVNQTSYCTGYQFGPPNGVTIQASNLPSNLTVAGWAITNDNTDTHTNSCNASECDVNFASGTLNIELTLNAPAGSGSSSSSSSSSSGGSCTAKPGAFSLSSSSTQTSIGLSWTTPSISCAGDSLEYYIFENGSLKAETNNTNSYPVTGLSCGTGYSFYVVAEEMTSSGDNGSTSSNTISPSTSSCSSGSSSSSGGSSSSSSGSSSSSSSSGSSSSSSSSGGSSSFGGSSSSSSSGSSSSGTLRTVGAAAAAATGSTSSLLSPQGNQSTNTPPNTPTGFTASTGANSIIVNLNWDPPTAGSAVSSYELDRSTDSGGSWHTLSNDIQTTSFADLTTNFNTHYLYRLLASNNSGSSGYTYASISTAGFEANAGPSQSTTLKSGDGISSVVIPAGALDQSAECGLAINPVLDSPNVKSYVPVAGPYTVTCKVANGTTVQVYNKPLLVTINTSNSIFKHYKSLSYYGQQTVSQRWSGVVPTTNATAHTVSFQLFNGYSFIVMGQVSHAPFWVTLLIIMLIVGGLGIGGIFALRLIAKRRQETAFDDSYRKEWGL